MSSLIMSRYLLAIAAMQVAGGMDWLVQIAENFLRKHPERIILRANRDLFNDTQWRVLATQHSQLCQLLRK